MHTSRRISLALGAAMTVLLLAGCSLDNKPAPVPIWEAPQTQIAQHAKAAGLEILPDEGTVLHIHTHLSISVNGQAATVPANIGIDTKQHLYSELHTHDTSGIIHVEATRKQTFYLRQFFKEWGVDLGKNSIGGFNVGENGTQVRMYVNGKLYGKGFDTLALNNKTDVSFAITTDGSVPHAAPKFKWPSNY